MAKNLAGYEYLAAAVVKQAVFDYRMACRKLKKNQEDAEALKEVKEIEDFFNSKGNIYLGDIDGRYILEQIKEELEHER